MGIENDSTKPGLAEFPSNGEKPKVKGGLPYIDTDVAIPTVPAQQETKKHAGITTSGIQKGTPVMPPIAPKLPDVITDVPNAADPRDFEGITNTTSHKTSQTIGIHGTGNFDLNELETDLFGQEVLTILSTKNHSIKKLYEFLVRKIETEAEPEKRQSLWEAAEAANMMFLRQKFLDMVHYNKNAEKWDIYQVANQVLYKLLSPDVRRMVLHDLFEFIVREKKDTRRGIGESFANAVANQLSPGDDMTEEVKAIFEKTFGIEHPLTTNHKDNPFLYPFSTKNQNGSPSWQSFIGELYKIRKSKSPVGAIAEKLNHLIGDCGEFGLLLDELCEQRIKDTLENEHICHRERIANDIASPGIETAYEGLPIQPDECLDELFEKCSEAKIMTQAALTDIYKHRTAEGMIITTAIGEVFVNAIERGIASLHDINRYLSTEARLNLFRKFGSLGKMKIKDFEKICLNIKAKFDELKEELEELGTYHKLRYRIKIPKLLEQIDFAWEKIMLPQLAMYGELVFSEDLAVPGKAPSFEE